MMSNFETTLVISSHVHASIRCDLLQICSNCVGISFQHEINSIWVANIDTDDFVMVCFWSL